MACRGTRIYTNGSDFLINRQVHYTESVGYVKLNIQSFHNLELSFMREGTCLVFIIKIPIIWIIFSTLLYTFHCLQVTWLWWNLNFERSWVDIPSRTNDNSWFRKSAICEVKLAHLLAYISKLWYSYTKCDKNVFVFAIIL